jgi:ParB-like chromosome segregation protein Spo0J
MKTSDLIPYARNAKQHPEEQVAQIAASIREFGMNNPVAVWHDKDGTPVIV